MGKVSIIFKTPMTSFNPNSSCVDLLRGVTIDNIAWAAFYYLINLNEIKELERIYPINIGNFIKFVTLFIKYK